ncbi:MAG: hypothetical protein DCC58_08160, partial [Chloroflexi bacterium]
MRVAFDSSHVTGDFASGKLVVRVTMEDDTQGLTWQDTIFFSVPPDFHAHNDLVAAALMAAVGRGFSLVRFNFPVSTRCADVLPRYHHAEVISRIDPHLEPRQPGRFLGISFSGGLDSVALWTLLRDVARIPFKVITAEYDGFHRESVGYASYQRDVSCWTNFRTVLGDRGRRFDAAIPLLFADYADLYAFATGHQFASIPSLWNDPASGDPPEFLSQNAVAEAGGLEELHILRCLDTAAVLQFLVATAPDRIERAWIASARPQMSKSVVKALMLAHAFRRTGQPVPAYLQRIRLPRFPERRGVASIVHLRLIWVHRFAGPHIARRVFALANGTDWTPLEQLSLEMYWKYIPSLTTLIPEAFRETLLAG